MREVWIKRFVEETGMALTPRQQEVLSEIIVDAQEFQTRVWLSKAKDCISKLIDELD